MKVVHLSGHRFPKALLVGLAAAVDVRLQTPVEIGALPSVGDFGFVVEIDFRYEKLGKTAGIFMDLLVCFAELCNVHGSTWRQRRCGLGWWAALRRGGRRTRV